MNSLPVLECLNDFGIGFVKEVRLQRKITCRFDEASFGDGTQGEKAGDLGNKRNIMRTRLKAG